MLEIGGLKFVTEMDCVCFVWTYERNKWSKLFTWIENKGLHCSCVGTDDLSDTNW